MTKPDFTIANPNSLDVRKSPLLPALLLMSMTSLTPAYQPNHFRGPVQGVCQGATDTSTTQAGWCLFIRENEKNANKKKNTVAIAKAKGVSLPSNVDSLPDKTLEILKERGITPDFINKSQENSLIIEFSVEGIYHMAEFCPDGDIVLLKENSDSIESWDLTDGTYIGKLEEFLSVEHEATLTE